MKSFGQGLLKRWKAIAAFISAVTALVAFIQLWRGDPHTTAWVAGGAALAVLLAFLLYVWLNNEDVSSGVLNVYGDQILKPRYSQRQKRLASLGILLILLGGLAGTKLVLRHRAI